MDEQQAMHVARIHRGGHLHPERQSADSLRRHRGERHPHPHPRPLGHGPAVDRRSAEPRELDPGEPSGPHPLLARRPSSPAPPHRHGPHHPHPRGELVAERTLHVHCELPGRPAPHPRHVDAALGDPRTDPAHEGRQRRRPERRPHLDERRARELQRLGRRAPETVAPRPHPEHHLGPGERPQPVRVQRLGGHDVHPEARQRPLRRPGPQQQPEHQPGHGARRAGATQR